MAHLTVHRHFKLQATIVGRNDLVTKTCSNRQIGFGEFIVQQPTGAKFTAKLFVVSKLKFDASLEWHA